MLTGWPPTSELPKWIIALFWSISEHTAVMISSPNEPHAAHRSGGVYRFDHRPGSGGPSSDANARAATVENDPAIADSPRYTHEKRVA